MATHWRPPGIRFGWMFRSARARRIAPGLRGWQAIRLRLPLATTMLLLAACATEAKYRTYVDGFVGKDANQLYATWGAPLRSAPTPDGGQVVSFLTNVQSGRGFGVAGCETSFILDRGGTVRQASFRGDACFVS